MHTRFAFFAVFRHLGVDSPPHSQDVPDYLHRERSRLRKQNDRALSRQYNGSQSFLTFASHYRLSPTAAKFSSLMLRCHCHGSSAWVVAIPERWLAAAHSAHTACHFHGYGVNQKSGRSSVPNRNPNPNPVPHPAVGRFGTHSASESGSLSL